MPEASDNALQPVSPTFWEEEGYRDVQPIPSDAWGAVLGLSTESLSTGSGNDSVLSAAPARIVKP